MSGVGGAGGWGFDFPTPCPSRWLVIESESKGLVVVP